MYGPECLLACRHMHRTSPFCAPEGLYGRGGSNTYNVMGHTNNFALISMKAALLFPSVV
jgi:hypothetical protein